MSVDQQHHFGEKKENEGRELKSKDKREDRKGAGLGGLWKGWSTNELAFTPH